GEGRDVGGGDELGAVAGEVALGDRRAEVREAPKRCVTVSRRTVGRVGQRVDDVLRRSGLRVSAPEIDDRLAFERGRGGDAGEQGAQVLLREPVKPGRPWAHRAIVGLSPLPTQTRCTFCASIEPWKQGRRKRSPHSSNSISTICRSVSSASVWSRWRSTDAMSGKSAAS